MGTKTVHLYRKSLLNYMTEIIILSAFAITMTNAGCDFYDWGEWSDCSVSTQCERGVRERTRASYSDSPSCHGLPIWACDICGVDFYHTHQIETCSGLSNGNETDVKRNKCSGDSEGYWLRKGSEWFLFVNKPDNWTEAYMYCHERNNMSLFTPKNEVENIWTIGMLHQLVDQDISFWTGAMRRGYWSGGNDFLNEGHFVHDDFLTPINYTNFSPGEPNEPDFGNEDCLEIFGLGMWNDFNCYAKLPFICHRKCKCNPTGVVDGSTCDRLTGECKCKLKGDPDRGGHACEPYITSITPDFGPVAGGTVIFIDGGYLDVTSIKMGEQDCFINQTLSNNTLVVCTTPSTDKARTINISIHQRDDVQIATYTFEYKPNPEIQRVSPLESFLSGGVILTVTGHSLDSISHPFMLTEMFYKDTVTLYPTACTVTNSTTMQCPTPEIHLPHGARQRKRREIKIRHKINDEGIEFRLGFLLDGFLKYRNLSDSLPEYSLLAMYDNPVITQFKEDNNVKTFRPHRRPFISIMGDNFDHAWKDQIKVTIGYNSTCHVTAVTSNQITCRPPEQKPRIHPGDYGIDQSPAVYVRIGKTKPFSVGYLRWHTSGDWWETDLFIIITSSVGSFIMVLLILCCVACRLRKRRKKVNLPAKLERELAQRNDYEKLSVLGRRNFEEMLSLLEVSMMEKVKLCSIEPSRLTLGPVVGRGHFGKVLQGTLTNEANSNPIKVAIKSMKGEHSFGIDDLKAFLEEALMTTHLEHNNVLSMQGIVLKDSTPYVVLPYMENGDLKTFISNPYNIFSVRELLGFGIHVARGMQYLASNKYIHRDLAARNCMVDKEMTVKVADFGLSRDIYEKEYYSVNDEKRPLPIKWMALESLKSGIFTTKSDVWAFGVVLWELIMRGAAPYADINNFQMKDYLMEGRRLSKPEYAPTKVFKLMTECWNEDPDIRPHFKNIVPRLMLIVNSQSQAKIKDVPIMKVEDYLQPLTMEHVQNAQTTDV